MLENVRYYLNQYWLEVTDKRIKHLIYFNESTPWVIVSLALFYVIHAKYVGPRLMAANKPYDLRKTMLVYNTIMSVVNFYALTKSLSVSNYGRRFLQFKYPDVDDVSPETISIIHLSYMYWLTKFLDVFDTIFFVLRKKHSHITLLHLYHHSIVPVMGWICISINPLIPAAMLFAVINSLVHTIMYSYYALSAIGPEIQKYLWWKRYITVLQLWQFVIYGVYAAIVFAFNTGYPRGLFMIFLAQPPLFFYMFYDFYRKAYRTKGKHHVDVIRGSKNNKNN